MKRGSLIAVLVLMLLGSALLVAGCSSSQQEPMPEGAGAVSIEKNSFRPEDITITPGQSVTWTNNDSTTHTVTGPGLDSGEIAPGATFTQTFDAAATIQYSCSINPIMTGRVLVKP